VRRLRAPTLQDAEAVAALIAAAEIAELGEAEYTLEDLRREWGESGFALGRDAVLVEQDGRTVGYAAFRRGSRTVTAVDPQRGGEGIGAALLDWCEARGRERGHAKYEQAVGGGNPRKRELLASRGYARVRSYWRLDRELGGEPEPPLPAGVTLRPMDVTADADALLAVNEAAFAQTADYEPETPATFAEHHLQAHDHDPALSRVALTDGEIAGFALVRRRPDAVAFVDLLAVHPAAAGRGIGGALLGAVFAAARAAGQRRVQLGVASDNPRAVGLYERAGMRVRQHVDAYERPVPD
jgi:mycothiol synthase